MISILRQVEQGGKKGNKGYKGNVTQLMFFPLVFANFGNASKNNKPRPDSADYCRGCGDSEKGMFYLVKTQILGVERIIFCGRGIDEKTKALPMVFSRSGVFACF